MVISVVDPNNLGNPTQQMHGSVLVKAGSVVVVSCRATSSNPEPVFTWYRDGFPVLANSIEKFNSTNQLVNKKEYNGVSYLYFIATSSDHLKEIRCDVRVQGHARTMHGSLTMGVKCKSSSPENN